MNSWPATQVDWAQLTGRLRQGELVCVVHGRVDAVLVDELPVCPCCAQLLSRAVCDRRTGRVVSFAEPAPAVCAGPQRHRLTGGTARLSWRSCLCAPAYPGAGGHRIWRCGACGSVRLYPPCAAPVDERRAGA